MAARTDEITALAEYGSQSLLKSGPFRFIHVCVHDPRHDEGCRNPFLNQVHSDYHAGIRIKF